MKINRTVAAMTVAGLCLSAAPAGAAEKENAPVDRVAPVAPTVAVRLVPAKRPAVLPALYATLGAVQAWDVYSTSAALKVGAREQNPAVAPFAGSTGSMIGLKAATTASTIYFTERLWRKNKVGAIVMMAAINGATAAVAVRNMRNAKWLAAQR